MKIIQNSKLKTKIGTGLVLFLITFALYTLYPIPYVSAQSGKESSAYTLATEPTPAATMSADLKLKLKALQDEIASKASKLKNEISKRLQNRTYTGYIKSKSATSLTIATQKGAKIININEYTEYYSQGKSSAIGTKTSLKNLNIDDFIITLGDIDDNDILTAKRIIKVSSTQPKEKKIVFGKVTNLTDQTVTIQTKQDQTISLSIASTTDFQLGKNDSDLKDVKIGNSIVAVGEESTSNNIKTQFIYILPSEITPAKLASPSAISSPSAKDMLKNKQATSSTKKK